MTNIAPITPPFVISTKLEPAKAIRAAGANGGVELRTAVQ
jgi:hypothetical protein